MIRTSDAIGVRPPTGRYSPFLQDTQQPGLSLERHVADLVKKQRAAHPPARTGQLNGRVAPVKAPRLMTEQLALDQLARDSSHVDRDERAGPALAVVVQRFRHQFFSRARLSPLIITVRSVPISRARMR